jgi:c-di-GMP-binding flagellar brake protein YcgR
LLVVAPEPRPAVERRQSFRVDVKVPFTFLHVPRAPSVAFTFVVEPAGGPLRRAVTSDLSAGGLRFVGEAVEVGAMLRIELAVPEEQLSVLGQVVRRRELAGRHEAGVQFVGLRQREEACIVRFIHRTEVEGRWTR